MNVTARVALHPANLVLVLRDHDMRRVPLALGAIRLDVGADLVDLVLEHEIHVSPRVPSELA